MSCVALPSAKLAEIRNKLKKHLHDGVWLSPDDVHGLITDLNSAHALAIEIEDEKQILERQQRLGTPIAVHVPPQPRNVVAFPKPKPRRVTASHNDGGDAA
jgi:hypothetical protein